MTEQEMRGKISAEIKDFRDASRTGINETLKTMPLIDTKEATRLLEWDAYIYGVLTALAEQVLDTQAQSL